MTNRNHKTKSGTIFEWEETPELLEYILNLEKQNVTNTTRRGQDSSEKGEKNS